MARKSVSGTLKEEIHHARSNLDNLLQKIHNSKVPSSITQTDDEDENVLSSDRSPGRDGGGDGSPRRKGSAHTAKKRKRGLADPAHTATTNTYIVKLFDRNVDLALYNQSAPLYPICRSWMRNTANDQYIEQPSAHEQQTGGEAQFPDPYMTSKHEELYKLKIPESVKRNEKPLDIYAEPEDAEDLLIKHIAHWKKVRESWRAAGKAYEARFSTSNALLKQMYEAATK